ncbi:MAG: hypothetical protein A2Y62_20725 [Candidatus Fischerbacteria bacterium RBG_13_37_8]|uniref:Methyltransferase domain-containing protein n=1 Tax=Candidatus Fischerbacteria bacterium RBG_13_37_8 TaxID=1817863 RepID=A0A1F5VXV6_9BACT|nr:MAG: hypothetical protein A2Y62_20725 [Candidatus Fischerbacteria bacterium RBG_13_37_8]
MDILVVGNTAKLYCLNWIEDYIKKMQKPVSILDLGCGEALSFIKLLERYPDIYYMGIEPDKKISLKAQKNLAQFNAKVQCAYAYDIGKRIGEKFEIVVSFSVLEHVYRRQDYMRSAKECLKDEGYFLINYDAGHFTSPEERNKIKDLARILFARMGIEKYYQSFVKEEEFQALLQDNDFKVVDAKFFNSYSLKGFYREIAVADRPHYMEQWLESELSLNSLPVTSSDKLSHYFATRNYILRGVGA